MEYPQFNLKIGSLCNLNIRDHVARSYSTTRLRQQAWDHFMSLSDWRNEVFSIIIFISDSHWEVFYNVNIFRLIITTLEYPHGLNDHESR